jgi:LacI family transcriptional regulator
MITIKDVAKAAGVSISTTSYALNNKGNVSKEKKDRILRIAKELNYSPNGAAKNLKKQKTELVGLFVHDINGPFYNELIRGIQQVTTLNGYELVIFCDSGSKKNSSYNFLSERRVDGAIIISSTIKDDEIMTLSNTGLPIVVLDREITGDKVCNVLVDNKNGASNAVNHLIAQGYRDIAFLSGPEEAYDNKKRFEGYLKTLKSNGIKFNEHMVLKGKFTENSGYDAVINYLEINKKPPGAIFSSNDEMAIGAVFALRDSGYNVPKDVAVVGFDNLVVSSYITPPLTTVKRPMYEMGLLSTHTLFNMLNGCEVNKSVTLTTKIIIKDSNEINKLENK